MINKIIQELLTQCRNRGTYITFLMYLSHLNGVIRGIGTKLVHGRTIQASIFMLQANSRIEIFNKKARVIIGKFVYIRKNASVRIDQQGELILEDKVFINDNCNIHCANKIRIGAYTKIGPNVCINDHDHDYKHASDEHLLKGEVMIGRNVWIGSHVVILRNTYIGDNAVIAAGSVVKGEVPANTLFLNQRENKTIPFHIQGMASRGVG